MIGLFTLVIIGLSIGFAWFIYVVSRKIGYPRTGKYLTLAFGLLVLIFILGAVFEDQLFTENEAKELVEEQQF